MSVTIRHKERSHCKFSVALLIQSYLALGVISCVFPGCLVSSVTMATQSCERVSGPRGERGEPGTFCSETGASFFISAGHVTLTTFLQSDS